MIHLHTVESVEKELCTGCGVCANACPSGCIRMQADAAGFFYPCVDTSTCCGCENCVAKCPVINPPVIKKDQKEPEVYAAWSLDREIRYASTSGGIFTELAKAVLRRGGYVAGAKYTKDHLVEHALIDHEKDIALLRQSKYVQSEAKAIYKQIEVALQTGKPVLFVGTPCQCAGLHTFLGHPYENLIICDFICRGVNSPKVYIKYLQELESQYKSRVKQVWFKNKTYGWNKFCTKILFENGQEYYGRRDTDPFMYGYIKKELNLYMRSSCGQCRFKGSKRPVDLTLGDFWGVQLQKNEDMKNGVSVVLVHTHNGMQLFESLRNENKLFCETKQLSDVIQGNACLLNSARTEKSNNFYLTLKETENFSKSVSIFANKKTGVVI